MLSCFGVLWWRMSLHPTITARTCCLIKYQNMFQINFLQKNIHENNDESKRKDGGSLEMALPGCCSRYLVVQEDSKMVRHSSGPSPLHSCNTTQEMFCGILGTICAHSWTFTWNNKLHENRSLYVTVICFDGQIFEIYYKARKIQRLWFISSLC